MSAKRLTRRQERFVAEYVSCLNGRRAAIRAGYSAAAAAQQASNMLGMPAVQEAVARETEAYMKRVEVTTEKVLRELALIAHADMADYVSMDDSGVAALDWENLPPGASKAIAEIIQEEYVEGKGDNAERIRRTKFKLHSKTQALEMLGKYLKLFHDKEKDSEQRGASSDIDAIIVGVQAALELRRSTPLRSGATEDQAR